MIKPLNIGETFEYSLERDKEDPTVFILGILDSIIKSKLFDLGMVYRYNPDAPKDSVAEARMSIAEQNLDFVRFSLKGFRNFRDKSGNDIKFKTVKRMIGHTEYEIASDEILKLISREDLSELARKISNTNNISETERKN